MIRIEGVTFSVGDFSLSGVSFEVLAGEYFVLLGRPGSGKTLLLECIAGLQRIASGRIAIGGRRVDTLEPADRNVGYVPQDYALFSRRSVRQNIELGLRARGVGPAERTARAERVTGMLGVSHLLERGIPGLSGGERQRVALARALATEPDVLLLDEPVNALDPETRDTILGELRRVHLATGTSTVHVCHDLDEMRAVADRVGIMHEGRLIQAGTPSELAGAPAAPAVARLMRLGAVLPAVAEGRGGSTRLLLPGFEAETSVPCEGEVEVLLRAARLRVHRPGYHQGFPARVVSVLRREMSERLVVAVGSTEVHVEVPLAAAPAAVEPGAPVSLEVSEDAVHVFQGSIVPE